MTKGACGNSSPACERVSPCRDMMKRSQLKRSLCTVLAVLFSVLCITSCADGATPTCASCADAVLMSQSDMPQMTHLAFGEDGFDEWVQSVYKIEPEDLVDGAVYYADGTSAEEIAVLRFAQASEAGSAVRAMDEYVDERRDTFSGYAPFAELMLEQSLRLRHNDYAALLVVPSPSTAEIAFDGSFAAPAEASPEPSAETTGISTDAPQTVTPAAAQEMDAEASIEGSMSAPYSHDAVLAAWNSGNPTSLAAQDRAVYDAATQIIAETTNDSMSPYQKERAIHDRLVQQIDYDALALARDSSEEAPPESSTPYGALVLNQAICYGYSSSFQLLMDMLGIECITVDGTINEDNDPHSWNMVNLDGSWYLVDVTWDDPINSSMTYTFFNRSDEEFRGYNRKWSRDDYPAAQGGVWAGSEANGV